MKNIILLAPIFLVACAYPQNDVYTDPTNGCQYIMTGKRTGITPRLNADGTQVCNPTNPAQKDEGLNPPA